MTEDEKQSTLKKLRDKDFLAGPGLGLIIMGVAIITYTLITILIVVGRNSQKKLQSDLTNGGQSQ